MAKPVVSRAIAPDAWTKGDSALFRSRLSRSAIWRASSSKAIPGNSPARLLARSSGAASRKTLTLASGKTTVPISRPSMTTLSDSAIRRCWATSAARTGPNAATLDAADEISVVRITSVTSSPFSTIRRSGRNSISAVSANRSRSATSSNDRPRRRPNSATARYMAPVSI